MSRPTATQIQNTIITVLEVSTTPQTHEDVARKLRWLANAQRIAANMNRLAREGVLNVACDDNTKRYTLVKAETRRDEPADAIA